MSASAPRSPPRVSITPLLKRLVTKATVPDGDIEAALLLNKDGNLSNAQASLLLSLLSVRRFQLDEEQVNQLNDFVNVTKSLPDHKSVTIGSLLRELLDKGHAAAEDIADALSLMLDDCLSTVQSAMLLGCLAFAGLDREPVVLVRTAEKMLAAADRPNAQALRKVVSRADRTIGRYHGGLCDIVGTGGDGHSTYNVSTTASIIASSLLMLSKHGNRASSSTSGSADLLEAVRPKGPKLNAVTSVTLPRVYDNSSYAFLFAPLFHSGMKHVAALRKDLGISTIFNLLGPLVNPVEDCIEARIVGVAKRSMGPVFAEALRMKGAQKALVVCGAEDLDEISCAGKTFCWQLVSNPGETKIEEFELHPADFGLPSNPLSKVAGGKSPQANAEILIDLLNDKLPPDDPVLNFVLINTAALLAIAGVCEEGENGVIPRKLEHGIEERGPGGQRWKEGVRIAQDVLRDKRALQSFHRYINITNELEI